MVLYVEDQDIKVIELDKLVSNTVNEYKVEFIFDKETWIEYDKIAVFRQHMTGLRIDVPIVDNTIGEEDTTFVGICTIPWDVLDNDNGIYIGVYGMKSGYRKPTIYTNKLPVALGTSLNGHTSSYVRTIYEESIEITKNNAELSNLYAKNAAASAQEASLYKYYAGDNISISDENIISSSDSFKDLVDSITAEDEGKVLKVVNGQLILVSE